MVMVKRISTLLTTRPKWTEEVKDLQDGDLVIAAQSGLPRGHWPLGRIITLYPGRDGHQRVAKAQCGDKMLMWPGHKLVPLDR